MYFIFEKINELNWITTDISIQIRLPGQFFFFFSPQMYTGAYAGGGGGSNTPLWLHIFCLLACLFIERLVMYQYKDNDNNRYLHMDYYHFMLWNCSNSILWGFGRSYYRNLQGQNPQTTKTELLRRRRRTGSEMGTNYRGISIIQFSE